MAKKLVYDVEINSDDATNSIKRIQEKLKDLNESATDSTKQINGLTQELKSLTDIRIDNASNVTSVKDLRKAYKDLVDLQLQFGSDSDVFKKASIKAGELKDKLADVQDSIKNFSNSPVENLSNSFTTLRTKILALDLQGTKAAFGNLLTNFSALATSTIGITTGMSAATVATRVFTAALVATGIGAFVVAIGLIIANFETLKNSGGLIGKTFTFIGDTIEATTVAFLKLSDAIGLTDNALDEYNKKEIDPKAPKIKTTAENIEELDKKIKELVKTNDKLGTIEFGENIAKNNKTIDQNIESIKKTVKEAQDANKEIDKKIDNLGKQVLKATSNFDFGTQDLSGKIQIIKDTWAAILGVPQILGGTPGVEPQLKQISELQQQVKDYNLIIEEGNVYTNKLAKYRTLLINEQNKKLDEEAKKAGEEAKKRFEDAYNVELKSIENKKTLRDIEANTSYTDDEKLKTDLLSSENKFLSDKLALNQRYGKETLSIRLSQAQAEVKIKQDFYNEDRKNADARIKGNEEIMKSMNDRLSLLDKIGTRKKELDLSEIGDLQTEILVADERLRILEQYGIDSGVIYDDAIHKKMVAEQNLTEFLRKEGDKRKEEDQKIQESIKANRKITIQASLQGGNMLSSSLQKLSNTVYENEIANAEGNAAAQEKLRKEQFEANKNFAIVNAIINTALAVTQALSSSPPPASYILAAASGIAGGIEIASIASQQYTSTGGGAAAAAGNAAGSQAFSATAQTPNINFAQAGSGSNLNESGLGSTNPSFTGFVSVSEINNVQNNIQAMEGSSLLGG
jgi:hypothetical protein